jgi:hypothetical protein
VRCPAEEGRAPFPDLGHSTEAGRALVGAVGKELSYIAAIDRIDGQRFPPGDHLPAENRLRVLPARHIRARVFDNNVFDEAFHGVVVGDRLSLRSRRPDDVLLRPPGHCVAGACRALMLTVGSVPSNTDIGPLGTPAALRLSAFSGDSEPEPLGDRPGPGDSGREPGGARSGISVGFPGLLSSAPSA